MIEWNWNQINKLIKYGIIFRYSKFCKNKYLNYHFWEYKPKQEQQRDNVTSLPHPSMTDRSINVPSNTQRSKRTQHHHIDVLRHWSRVFRRIDGGLWVSRPGRSVTQPEDTNRRPVLSKHRPRCLTGCSSRPPQPFTWPVSQELHCQHQQPSSQLASQHFWVP